MKKKQYKEMYEMFLEYQESRHEANQKKIRVGLKVNIVLPLVFLIISFLTDSSKLIFLILWIVSLFGIAFYLIYVEFSDYKMQEKMKEFNLIQDEERVKNLIGKPVEAAENKVTDKIDAIDSRIDEEKRRLEAEIEEEKKKMAEKLERLKALAAGKEEDNEKHH